MGVAAAATTMTTKQIVMIVRSCLSVSLLSVSVVSLLSWVPWVPLFGRLGLCLFVSFCWFGVLPFSLSQSPWGWALRAHGVTLRAGQAATSSLVADSHMVQAVSLA